MVRERVVPQGVQVRRPGHRAVVDRTVVGQGSRDDVDHCLAVPHDPEPVALGHLADRSGQDAPLRGDGQDLVEVGRGDDREHPLLRLARQDLGRVHRGLAQRHPVQMGEHAALTGCGRLAQGAGQPRAAKILDALDQLGVEDLQAGLDQQLLGERVTDLDGRAVGRTALVEGGGREHADAPDAVAAGLGAEQHDDVADAPGRRQLDPLDRHDPEAERIDQRIALVRRVEHDLAADVGQSEAVAVAADARDDSRQHPGGVGMVGVTEPQRVHHQHRAGAHREDVADDPADPGGRALVGLDIARVVVALDLEGDREAFTDVDDTGVLAHADQHPVALGQLGELPEVHLAALVGAVLTPHDRVHRQLARGGASAEQLDDAGVLVVLEAESQERLVLIRGLPGPVHGVDVFQHQTSAFRTEVKKPRPSVPGPVRSSTACSGWGMIPTTLPAALVIPAMSRRLPFGLPS